MRPRLGLRSRILALTMPILVLVSAAVAGVIYLSLSQVLEASARELAVAEVDELLTDISLHTIEDLATTHDDEPSARVLQVVDAAGTVVLASTSAASSPIIDPGTGQEGVRVVVEGDLPGVEDRRYAVAVGDGTGLDGRRYTAIVAVPTRVETTALGRSLEFGLIGAIGLVAILGAVTTFAVGQALRPVDRMRDQAEAIASSRPTTTLEVPAGGDELSRLAETLNGVLERLRRADASRRAFVADAGHELRSPLATIRVLIDRLAEERPEAERRQAAERAAAEVDRLAVLVDDLLALASADEHAMALATDEVDLDDVVLSETGALRERGMPVTVAVEPVRVLGDPHRLGRVVRNLLENAERHREEVVRLHLSSNGSEAVLLVDNDGPPVAVEDRERIFGRFVRLDDSRTRHTGGTGLGLAIVSEIVRAHGGSVRAEESPEGWCRFSVRIPLEPRPG
jgi:two-component system, OmpR family, sensor kinase